MIGASNKLRYEKFELRSRQNSQDSFSPHQCYGLQWLTRKLIDHAKINTFEVNTKR